MAKPLLLLVLIGVAVLALMLLEEKETADPNVVFILVDTLRADRMDAQRDGQPIAPFLTARRDEGLAFDHALSPCSWTKPAMASLFTSLDVDAHELFYSSVSDTTQSVPQVLAEAHETITEYLVRHGYDAWGFQTNANLKADQGFAQGFEPENYPFINGARAEQVTRNALKALPNLKPPFFMYCHYMDPHAPYNPPKEALDLFPTKPALTPEEEELLGGSRFMDLLREQSPEAKNVFTDAFKAEALRRYDAEVRAMDTEVARLVQALERQHPNTLFVLLSDHGEEFWERGGMGHGTTLHEEQEHVPFFFWGAKTPRKRIAKSVSTLDLLPTLAALLGFDPAPQWQGKSLIEDTPGEERPVYARTYGVAVKVSIDDAAIWKDQKKLIQHHAAGESAAFDLKTDAAEKKILIEAPFVGELALLSETRRAENILRSRANKPAAAAPMSEEEQAALEALGYTGDEAYKPTTYSNVLLVIIDTLRADRIEADRGGAPVMPALARLAQRSWYYPTAIAQATWTKPSVVSILTGLYPQTHHTQFGIQKPMIPGQRMEIEGIPSAVPTLAELLKTAGFFTGCVQTNVHLQADYGFARGFDHYRFKRYADAHTVTNESLALLAEARPPFFLYAHYFDPHASYDPPAPYREVFGPRPELTDSDRYLLNANDYHQGYYLDRTLFDLGLKTERSYAAFSEAGRAFVRHQYDGECRFTDAEVDRLVRRVRIKYPDTLVVVVSDHGEEFWEHGSIGHGKTVYGELTQVPLIIAAPAGEHTRIETPVETIDLLPTIAAQLQLDPDPAWQGRNIAPRPDGSPPPVRPVFSQTSGSFPEAKLNLEMARHGSQKLIVDQGRDRREFYDLALDPAEANNLYTGDTRLPAEVEEYLDAHHSALETHAYADVPPEVYGLREEQREQLEALGYLDGGGSDHAIRSTP